MRAILTALKANAPRWVKSHVKVVSGVAAGLVIGGAGSAVVMASIPDASGVIHACYSNGVLGRVRIIDDATQTCNNNETAISWNQQGPAGPQGPVGPQGSAGDGALAYGRVATVPQPDGSTTLELDEERSEGVASVGLHSTGSHYCIELEPGIVPTNVLATKVAGGEGGVPFDIVVRGVDEAQASFQCPQQYDIMVSSGTDHTFYFRVY